MTGTLSEPTSSLTYGKLLAETADLLRSLMSCQACDEPNRTEKAQLHGIIVHWYVLANLTDCSREQREADYLELKILTGVGDSLDKEV
ncbi:hypothetical protein [Serratia fonticola]|uniref:hypothetical protein n=1 Tax=Serratia fonticola TaxID=47917 RepID=UPI003B00CF79